MQFYQSIILSVDVGKSLIVLRYQQWQLTLVKSDYKKISSFLWHNIDLINIIKARLNL